MSRGFKLFPTALAILVAAALLPGCQGKVDGGGSAKTAYFKVAGTEEEDAFVIALTDPATIAEARAIVDGQQPTKVHVTGLVVAGEAAYNRPWHFYLDPSSISFFELSTEVCDAATSYVEAHLAEVGGAFLPGRRWCPWSSRVIAEVEGP